MLWSMIVFSVALSLEKVKGEVSLVPGGIIIFLGLKKLIHF